MAAPLTTKRKVSRVAIGLLVLSVVVGAASVVRVALAVAPSLTEPSFSIPGQTTAQLEPGTYALFEQTGSRAQTGPVSYSSNRGATIRPADVTVTDASGQTIAVDRVSTMQTLQRGEEIFTAAVSFRVATAGRYTVVIDASESPGASSSSGTAVLAPELTGQLGSLVVWFVLIGISGVVFVVSFIAMMVSALRAAKANRPPFVPPPTFRAPPTGMPY